MGFAINTNNDALNTYRNLTTVQNSLSKSLEKLSSGLRINQAGDDAAGLTISTQLASQVSGLQQASRNAQDGTSLVQTADGALTQAQSILGRMRDLAVQAGNDSNSTAARTAITNEAASLTAELSRIGNSVNFNGQNLLDGTTPTFKFQVGADGNSQSQIAVDLRGANLVRVGAALSATTTGLTVASADLTKVQDTAGVTFTSTTENAAGDTTATSTAVVSLAAFTGTPTAADYASALNANADFSSKFTATVTYNTTTGAATGIAVASRDGGAVTAGSTANATIGTDGQTVGSIAFDSAVNAQAAIRTLDVQIAAVSSARASIGAIENRFNNVVSTIATSVTNLTAAKSRITDVDMAQEMVNYTRANVLSQAGTAMLAQANSLPQLALKLLG
ncbi:flagellin [uncultured Amnibacterium sp.]|uniref:flagellin N-terminal helical domain-containing protein n=1 Tax=uncultured Amnibacterium sp. TaxID=1631851 RepID=UPI0035CAB3B3